MKELISEADASIRQASLSLLIVMFWLMRPKHNVSFDAMFEVYVSDTYKVNLCQKGGR